MVNLTIDNRKIEAEAGRTVLEVARENGIVIPTLFLTETGRRKKTAIQPRKPELEKVSGVKSLH